MYGKFDKAKLLPYLLDVPRAAKCAGHLQISFPTALMSCYDNLNA